MDIVAEMVANVMKVVVAPGDRLDSGDTVVLLESMKMEIPVLVEIPGTVAAVKVSEGDVVQEGDVLVTVERWSFRAPLDFVPVAGAPGSPPRRGAGVADRNRLESGRWQRCQPRVRIPPPLPIFPPVVAGLSGSASKALVTSCSCCPAAGWRGYSEPPSSRVTAS